MSDELIAVSPDWAKRAWVDDAKYKSMYEASVKDPVKFWGEHGKRVDWIKPYSPGAVRDVDYNGQVRIRWFHDGVLNVSANCIDRHLAKRGDQTAIIWEGDDPSRSKHITYRELHAEVCRMANALKELGVKKGDRVTIYLPMIPEAAYAMLACARIGAIHSVVFGGFSPDSLAQRIKDCKSNVVITADEGLRGGKKVPLKANTDAAIYAGIRPARIIIVAMAISGGLAGFMAVNEVLGAQHRLVLEYVQGAGFVGIAVALMGRSPPAGIVLAALLFGLLYQGGTELSFAKPEINRDMIVVIQGLVILFMGALEQTFRPLLAALFFKAED